MSGFFSGALGELRGALGGSGADADTGGNLLQSAFNAAGGTEGIIQKAQAAGLGDKVQSWIGPGSNIPMLAEEVTRIFPPQQIDDFAARHGVPAGLATQILAHLIPHAVDQQTGDGAQTSEAASGGFDFGSLASKILGKSA
ncbi:YidB family protein [Acetobacteraceae bacterium KSS8]|uniref:YidB family protein n=2 Tax=Endosaccharibacter trunci TaxID=2812733 RepID=A0ABT1WA25_9PROT|nr:YidB family protein [Acetobacteraceae bacterium KSS8]